MSENKTPRTSDARTEASIVLGFLILSYFFLIIVAYETLAITMASFGASLASRSEVPWEFLQFQSIWYLATAPAIIPHAWYLYSILKRETGSEAPGAGVGVIAPMVVGYVLSVLGPTLGIYPSIGSLIRSLLGFGLRGIFDILLICIVLEPFYIIYLLLFVRTKNGESESPEEAEEWVSESEEESTKEGSTDIRREDTGTRKIPGVAFKLFVLGYVLLLTGFLFSFLFLDSPSNYILYNSVLVLFYIGVSLMILSQAWYQFVGRHKGILEMEELRNTLIEYIGVPITIIFILYFLVPVFPGLGFVYQSAAAILNILVYVLLLAGPIYAALFYVYKIA